MFHENLVAAAGERGRKAQKRGVAIELESRLKHPWNEWYTRAESGVDRDGIRCTVRPVLLPPEDRRKGRGPFMFKRDPEPALFALEWSRGVVPSAVMRHSVLGEIVAACVGGFMAIDGDGHGARRWCSAANSCRWDGAWHIPTLVDRVLQDSNIR